MNILERIAKYFYNRMPVVCFVCNTPHARKSMQYERNNMNKLVPLCLGIIMPCGHLARYAVNVDEGTQYCLFCAADEMFDSLRNYKDYRNMLEHSPQMKDGYISINTLLLFDESDANAFDNYSKIKGEDNYE